ncbi:hypothetical protein BTA51_14005 [Hahella sp. CCB-MM4]|uniref:type III secretion system chaperone n=1 Tax=Hahella sp. (strain CCB-MM4) TaxID=1926491 RepID=UPI000B9A1A4C|nr:type III secretion system chaperone [Hahella sp. CCB-MM4]OZG72639.1 hypothetical protein BTA51_14005 [Hahella sp. CCB-MM4]
MNIDTLIADLAKQLNLEDSLQLNEHGYLALEVNDSLVVNLQWHSADEHLIIFTPLFNLSEAIKEDQTKDTGRLQNQLLSNLLGANLFWQGTSGGTLSLDQDSGWIWLMDKRSFGTISQPGVLADWLLQHIETSKTFISLVIENRGADAQPKAAPGTSAGKEPGNGHWIQG